MYISPLREDDVMTVEEWAVDYLSGYVKERSRAYGVKMTDEEILAHIDDNNLDHALWHDLVHADYSEGEFVAVVREGNAPRGMIMARERIDPYLRVSVGQIRWIYVDPKHRRQGLAQGLIAAAEEWMKNRGVRARETTLHAHDDDALAFYRSQGYAAILHQLIAPGEEA